jgi:hypothetical protein
LDVADADSSGLVAAFESLLDDDRQFRDDEFESVADPVVYVYRFCLHPDFGEWKLPAMHAFCESFDCGAIILAQRHTTAFFTEGDFKQLGFRVNSKAIPPEQGEEGGPTRFMLRDNATGCTFKVGDYPDESPPATTDHQQWLKRQGPWNRLC